MQHGRYWWCSSARTRLRQRQTPNAAKSRFNGRYTPPAQTAMQGSGALLLLLSVRSSFSVSIRRHCTQVLNALSSRTASQLSKSVKTRLMLSLTWQSLDSSPASSSMVDSSMTVSSLVGDSHDGGRAVMAGREVRRCSRLWTRDREELRELDEEDDG